MSEIIQSAIDQRMAQARQYPALCPAPYVTLDVRQSEHSNADIFQTCCCNLDAELFVPSAGADPFAEIKQQQAQGQWPEACRHCKWEEQNGGQSERLRSFVEMPQDRLDHFIESKKITEFEFRIKFSNFCSLSCRSCSPYESSTFGKITNTVVNENFEIDISEFDDHWKFITQTILEKYRQVPHFFVHFIGGETLIQPGMLKLLNWMVGQGIASAVNLRLTTALTVNPTTELMLLMSKFNTVDILLSIDSVGENYQYIRWPAKFEKIERNLDTLISYESKLTIHRGKKILKPIWKCAVSPVFSLNNIFYMDQWINYWYKWYQQRGFVFHNYAANLVAQTEHLDVQALPIQYRPALIELLQACLAHDIFQQYPDQMRGIYNFITTTIGELNTSPDRPELWDKYLRHTKYFDQKTKLQFAKFNERLYNLLTESDRLMLAEIDQQVSTTNSLTQAMIFKRTNVQS
jgi:hypothetical protein